MPNRPKLARVGAIAGIVLIPLSVAACSSNKKTDAGSAAGSASSTASSSASSMSSAAASTSTADAMNKPFGAGCAAVPASGAGSFDGMSTTPVATAASSNPVLSTLVTAVKAAGLADALNSQKAITVFAPANTAFSKVPKATLDSLLADPKGSLTTVLTYHVVPGRLAPDQLAGTHKTLEGGTVTVSGSGDKFTVGSGKANVVCGNVQTANATVYIIDGVLTPAAR
jgi:uncharacterized surface protein with fasciclin (FAS1) repeats